MHASKAKQEIFSLNPISRQVLSHLQETRVPSWLTVTWEHKCHHIKCPGLPSSCPCFICWAWCHMVRDIPLVRWGQLTHLCPLPTFCAPWAYSLSGQC